MPELKMGYKRCSQEEKRAVIFLRIKMWKNDGGK